MLAVIKLLRDLTSEFPHVHFIDPSFCPDVHSAIFTMQWPWKDKRNIYSFMAKKVFEDFSNPTSRHLEASPIFSKGWGPLALSGQPNIA